MMVDDKTSFPGGTSPAASGPAGSLFEGQVGAAYLLSMLTGAEPRGLPGTSIDRVELQRAGEGYPLDDVIVQAHDGAGNRSSLEVQVKRTIDFTASDAVFKKVVAQMADAARKPGFWERKHQLAVATARTSRKIEGAYQDVLTWARQIGTAEVFAERIAREGSSSEDMRKFVRTFKSNLAEVDCPNDDETIWKLLRRFQILIFDFTATGSASETLARERSARALMPDDAGRGGDLWTALTALATKVAAAGGDRTRPTLRSDPDLANFRWAGEPRHLRALAALATDGADALADIRDQINGVSIGRAARVAEVRAGLEAGRYVEIRGDAGVGKSGILKHLAIQAQTETGIIVLKPGRTPTRGWFGLRERLQFDGAARDLLVELAADGTGLLFVDNLDLFSEEERPTVNDLIRAAASVSGFSVIATARRNFGVDELGWLTQEGLDELGRGTPIFVDELNEAEVEEMAAAAPFLASLLASSHPARDVTRNLFRLARLANRSSDAPVLRTETDMATEWWDTADGQPDGRRERQRVIRFLAEQALSPVAVFDVSSQPSGAVDALVRAETLQEYGDDKVGFRHDVLREWAVAKFIALDPQAIDRLHLDQPAPSYLARSIELYARSLIEQGEDCSAWDALLSRLSAPGVHATWRRAVLMALVRSEAASRALRTARPRLLAENGALLNELIRTTTAVDAQAAREAFAESGFNLEALPESLMIPVGPSWSRLISWILRLGDDLPGGSLPDVVDLFTKWSTAMLGTDPVTPLLLRPLFSWLTAIEEDKDERGYSRSSGLFGNALTSSQIDALEGGLRRAFAMFANRDPALAGAYLQTVMARKRRERLAQELHEFRGTLAAAAPNEMADLFEAALIPPARPERPERYSRSSFEDRIFTFLDSQFLPVSPAQGPFYDLLVAAPETGKRLIRRLVDYAITAQTQNYTGDVEFIEIALASGPRRFTWPHTYLWSRESYSRFYAVSSGLMALEAWAHGRVEAGVSVGDVIAEVIGDGDAPACYLLIAVDLILSHWPASKDVAILFVANPDLIILDRERGTREGMEMPDLFGLREIQREPVGPVSLKALNERPSRGTTLYENLKFYTHDDNQEHRDRLVALLREAMERLPEPGPEANFGIPEFMVRHALNQLDAANWAPVEGRLPDGRIVQAMQYVAPQSEADHLAPFQAESQRRMLEVQIQQAAGKLLDAPGAANPEAVGVMADWARDNPPPERDPYAGEDDDDRNLSAWARGETSMNIASIAMRDGDEAVRSRSRDWAHRVFAERLARPIDSMRGSHDRLQYNPLALAFAGYAFSLRDQSDEADIRRLLEIAGNDSMAAAPGFAASATAIAQVDERLLKAILRCALRARIRCHRSWELDEADYDAKKAELRASVDAGIALELDWLAGRAPEPHWPELPFLDPSPRRGIRIGAASPPAPRARRVDHELFADSQGAAAWLDALAPVSKVADRPWLRDLVEHYREWTSNANGSGLEDDRDVERAPSDWNDAYFKLMAACLPGLTASEVDSFALEPIAGISPNASLSASAKLLRNADVLFLDFDAIDPPVMVHIRQSLFDILSRHYGWDRFASERSASSETHMADTVSALLFHVYNHGFAPPKCYLVPGLVEKTDPFLPVVTALATGAPTILIAAETMSFFETSPRVSQLPFAIEIGKCWVASRPDDTGFWVDYAVGRKLCQWLGKTLEIAPEAFRLEGAYRRDIDAILAALVRAGVPEAGQLEARIAR